MGSLLILILASLLGWPIAYFLFKEKSGLEKLALAWLVGSFLVAWQLFIFLFCLKLETFWWFNLIFLVEVCALWYFLKVKISLADFKISKENKFSLFEKIVFSFIAGVILFSFVNAVSRANVGWDSLAMWSLKAKQIYYSERVIFDVNSPASWQAVSYSQYPWQNPLLYVWGNKLNGSYSDQVNNVINWFYYLSTIIIIYGFLVKQIDRKGAAFFTLMFASAPIYYLHSFNSYSDLTLSCYVALALIFLWRIIEGNKLAYVGLALSLASAYMVKMDGLFALLVGSFFAVWFAVKNKQWFWLKIYTVFGVLLVLPWQIFKFVYHLSIANSTPEKIWHWGAVYEFWRTFWLNASFNIFAWLILAVLILTILKIKQEKKFLVTWGYVLLIALGFLYVYVSTSSYEHALDDTVLSRHIITLYPSLIIATALSWEKIGKKK